MLLSFLFLFIYSIDLFIYIFWFTLVVHDHVITRYLDKGNDVIVSQISREDHSWIPTYLDMLDVCGQLGTQTTIRCVVVG